MQIEIFTVCPVAILQGDDLTIFGARNNNTIPLPRFPVSFAPCIITKIRFEQGDEGHHKVEMIVMDADLRPILRAGKPMTHLMKADVQFMKTSPVRSFLNIVQNWLIYFEQPGEFYFQLKIDGEVKGSVPLYIVAADSKSP